ncbi:putative ATPase [Agrobacterium vitis]|nr:putative ATPase [Agrobacterium vitis]MBE1436984.1 putative ATPase [Agrobacterium vitis]
MNRFIILSGCSCRVKFTLLSALVACGFASMTQNYERFRATSQAKTKTQGFCQKSVLKTEASRLWKF